MAATKNTKQVKKKATQRKVTRSKAISQKAKAASRSKGPKVENNGLREEIIIFCVLAASIVLLISNFGVGGVVGHYISFFFFGIFGLVAYIAPFIMFFGVAFYVSNKDNPLIVRKMIGAACCVFFLCGFLQLLTIGLGKGHSFWEYYSICAEEHIGGGVIGSFQAWLFGLAFGTVGAYTIVIIGLIIAAIVMTQRSLLTPLKNGGTKAYQSVAENRKKRQNLQHEDKKSKSEPKSKAESKSQKKESLPQNNEFDFPMDELKITEGSPLDKKFANVEAIAPETFVPETAMPVIDNVEEEVAPVANENKRPSRSPKKEIEKNVNNIQKEIDYKSTVQTNSESDYKKPPLSLLKKGSGAATGTSVSAQRATALKLQQTLKNFGVNVTVSDVSCGPAVTRYELQPEQGVKVSKIVNLADDIKLNLAAADIRIEAPIPGKAAVGIEVPNDTNSAVLLRDIFESREFQDETSPIAFAVGKDIAGKPVIADIAKMPHLLIAGATGSGKSVCINTLIMSILYKSDPEDVKLVMIDPKVVELSVYNGIPHLFLPVVTDPKKAAGALNWAVGQMTQRYNKFAEYNVRDLKGYNAKVANIKPVEGEETPGKMPQIVIIVDELADLMMVAPGEVEDAICRLAQLARAAGIHLVGATQRPSVNVITGLIKANMPSRIAFSVSSGVDSRTIIDMHGAEKLLGKGDMLFYPQGYQKPVRVQGAFVADKEVGGVVEFLNANNSEGAGYNEEIEAEINNCSVASQAAGVGNSSEVDEYFTEAGRFIIEKDKASIGMLQRVFKIGFNRAARIMDQLCDAGVVGEEEGTKPRKVLMTRIQFDALDGDQEQE